MNENDVLDPNTSGLTDSGLDIGDTGSMDATGSEALDGTDGDGTATVVGGDTYVNVVSGDAPSSRVVTVNPYEIQEGDNSLLALVNNIFGDYQPRTQTVTETYPDGSSVTYTEVVDGLGGLDYYWLGGVLIFTIVLWSFFKFLGGIFKSR